MKVLVVGDVHWGVYSSIVRKRNEFYSQRLENLLWSINWVEKQTLELAVDKVIYLGDFMDRANLNAEELTAFRDIIWAKDIPHVFLVGNHEAGTHNLEYSSINFIETLGDNFIVINEPTYEVGFGCRFFYLPYIFENDRKPLKEYVSDLLKNFSLETDELKKNYIFSHNDIKGIQYGCVESRDGFEIEEISENCDLYVNGHIHNGGWVKKDKILNLGNLTGQNFNEDGFKYSHHIMLLDTYNQNYTFIDNPYAFNFIKLGVNNSSDLDNLSIPAHSVLSIKCIESLVPTLRDLLDKNTNVDEYRVISVSENTEITTDEAAINSIDHLQQFQEYIINQLGNTDNVVKELTEVLK